MSDTNKKLFIIRFVLCARQVLITCSKMILYLEITSEK